MREFDSNHWLNSSPESLEVQTKSAIRSAEFFPNAIRIVVGFFASQFARRDVQMVDTVLQALVSKGLLKTREMRFFKSLLQLNEVELRNQFEAGADRTFESYAGINFKFYI